jgi:AcrR family transcriptional regulator
MRYRQAVTTSGAGTKRPPPRDGPTLREQQKEFTRRRLVDAAVTVFERDGYVGSRIEDIAAEAGASRATFYLYFRSKLDVVRELVGPLRADSEALYRQLGAMADPSWDALYAWMSQVTGHWRRNRAAITVVSQAIAWSPS